MADIIWPSFKTKKAFKEAVKNGQTVFVTPVGVFPKELKEGDITTVVGPSEYDRKWYAKVTVGKNRQVIKVK